MPRKARLDVPGALHHIMVRGIDKSNIFRDAGDKARFLERLGQNVQDANCTVHAWVLMDNHVHLLFRSGKDGISSVMRKLLTWYAQYFNRRYGRKGHLFENRYKSILCDEENYLLALVRYIHLNPVRANIIQTLEDLEKYPWTGHRAVVEKTKYPWMDTATVLTQFGGAKRKAVKAYRQFMHEGMGLGHDPQFSGGGLVRSVGGWSKVLSLRRKGQRKEADERILGTGDFVHQVVTEAEDRLIRQMKHRRSGLTLIKIIEQECEKHKVSRKELESGSRRSVVSQARAQVARRGVEELGFSAAEIARHLGVATSSITRAVERIRRS
ncbi:MAG: transposase [Nitrospirota bacterium]|nr:transposase [Nitrospirota bacterium]